MNRVQSDAFPNLCLQVSTRVFWDGDFVLERRNTQRGCVIREGQQLTGNLGNQCVFLAFLSS